MSDYGFNLATLLMALHDQSPDIDPATVKIYKSDGRVIGRNYNDDKPIMLGYYDYIVDPWYDYMSNKVFESLWESYACEHEDINQSLHDIVTQSYFNGADYYEWLESAETMADKVLIRKD